MFRQEWVVLIIILMNRKISIKEITGFKNSELARLVMNRIAEILEERVDSVNLKGYDIKMLGNVSIYRKK